jgi:hypothetical protein
MDDNCQVFSAKNLTIGTSAERIDRGQAVRLKTLMAQEFREQLTYGTPSAAVKYQICRGKFMQITIAKF